MRVGGVRSYHHIHGSGPDGVLHPAVPDPQLRRPDDEPDGGALPGLEANPQEVVVGLLYGVSDLVVDDVGGDPRTLLLRRGVSYYW